MIQLLEALFLWLVAIGLLDTWARIFAAVN